MVFLAAGVAGRAVIQNGMLGIANIDTQQILDAMRRVLTNPQLLEETERQPEE
jgi:hypothetical protein